MVIDQVAVELEPEFGGRARGAVRGITAGEQLTIQGWVIGQDALPTGIELSDETGEKLADIAIDQSRPDIAEAFSDVPEPPIPDSERSCDLRGRAVGSFGSPSASTTGLR